jgi:hypothetical protein
MNPIDKISCRRVTFDSLHNKELGRICKKNPEMPKWLQVQKSFTATLRHLSDK